ncbi:hypothetical protein LZ30DRAFT_717393 [Colletotrichum cereale]|nr:hypothetical protein LZ30DRAFT_717393 [Colletotrichum cereale]
MCKPVALRSITTHTRQIEMKPNADGMEHEAPSFLPNVEGRSRMSVPLSSPGPAPLLVQRGAKPAVKLQGPPSRCELLRLEVVWFFKMSLRTTCGRWELFFCPVPFRGKFHKRNIRRIEVPAVRYTLLRPMVSFRGLGQPPSLLSHIPVGENVVAHHT